MTIHGIDVSAYQSATYSTSGLDFVFVKATEGLTYTNPRMTAQVKRARDAGLVVGFYHYPHMANDPIAEANYFLKQTPLQPGDVVVFDWEGYDTANKGVPKSRQLAYRDAWLKYVKSKLPSYRVGMYCNTDYWLNVDKTSGCGDFLWIATGGLPAGQPGIDYGWTFHQYSTAGGIDHDVANFDSRAALAAWAGSTSKEGSLVADKTDVKVLFQTDDVMSSPDGDKDPKGNAFWTAESYFRYGYLQDRETNSLVKALAAKLDMQAQTINQLVKTVATLAAGVGGLDPAAIVTELKAAIESITVHLDVPES